MVQGGGGSLVPLARGADGPAFTRRVIPHSSSASKNLRRSLCLLTAHRDRHPVLVWRVWADHELLRPSALNEFGV